MATEGSEDRVLIFDTTLRDGEQSPGCSMNLQEKLKVALALRDLGVDIIEAGFPTASPRCVEALARAETFAEDVESPREDAARTELDFLTEVVERVTEAGATPVNIPD